ncbi:MAG: hypothetical protein ACREAC_32275, partial [Blastocatellia bacterium]
MKTSNKAETSNILTLTAGSSLNLLARATAVSTSYLYDHGIRVTQDVLAAIARDARLACDAEATERIAEVIISSHFDEGFRNLGRFYLAQTLSFRGKHSDAERILDSLATKVPTCYQPRVLLGLAGTRRDAGDPKSSAWFCREALRASKNRDLLTAAQALRMLAVARSMSGDNLGALADLERLTPLAHYIGAYYPADYYNHLNSTAVELGQVGRTQEAKHLINLVLASPFAKQFPGWLQTREELDSLPDRIFTPFAIALGAPEEPASVEPSTELKAKIATPAPSA